MDNIIFVAFYNSLSLVIIFFLQNNVTHVKTGYKLWLPWIILSLILPVIVEIKSDGQLEI